MKYCPNCAETEKFRISTPLYYENGVWKQQKKCECGCIVILKFTEQTDKIIYPTKERQ